jgi:hypothetical protein
VRGLLDSSRCFLHEILHEHVDAFFCLVVVAAHAVCRGRALNEARETSHTQAAAEYLTAVFFIFIKEDSCLRSLVFWVPMGGNWNHLGAHKINNTIGQILLAKRMGKRRSL